MGNNINNNNKNNNANNNSNDHNLNGNRNIIGGDNSSIVSGGASKTITTTNRNDGNVNNGTSDIPDDVINGGTIPHEFNSNNNNQRNGIGHSGIIGSTTNGVNNNIDRNYRTDLNSISSDVNLSDRFLHERSRQLQERAIHEQHQQEQQQQQQHSINESLRLLNERAI